MWGCADAAVGSDCKVGVTVNHGASSMWVRREGLAVGACRVFPSSLVGGELPVWACAGVPRGGGDVDGHRDGDADVCEPDAVRPLEVARRGGRDAGVHAVDGAALLCRLRAVQRTTSGAVRRRHGRPSRPRHHRCHPAGNAPCLPVPWSLSCRLVPCRRSKKLECSALSTGPHEGSWRFAWHVRRLRNAV